MPPFLTIDHIAHFLTQGFQNEHFWIIITGKSVIVDQIWPGIWPFALPKNPKIPGPLQF